MEVHSWVRWGSVLIGVARGCMPTSLSQEVHAPLHFLPPVITDGIAPRYSHDEGLIPSTHDAHVSCMQGIWELSCDRGHAARVSMELLEALLLGLRDGPPAVQVVAMAAVWNLSVLSDVRGVLVQLGIVELLVEIVRTHCQWRLQMQEEQREENRVAAVTSHVPHKLPLNASAADGVDLAAAEAEAQRAADLLAAQQQRTEELQLRNRVVFHALGALAVLAVDAEARAHWIQVRPAACHIH